MDFANKNEIVAVISQGLKTYAYCNIEFKRYLSGFTGTLEEILKKILDRQIPESRESNINLTEAQNYINLCSDIFNVPINLRKDRQLLSSISCKAKKFHQPVEVALWTDIADKLIEELFSVSIFYLFP